MVHLEGKTKTGRLPTTDRRHHRGFSTGATEGRKTARKERSADVAGRGTGRRIGVHGTSVGSCICTHHLDTDVQSLKYNSFGDEPTTSAPQATARRNLLQTVQMIAMKINTTNSV